MVWCFNSYFRECTLENGIYRVASNFACKLHKLTRLWSKWSGVAWRGIVKFQIA